MSKASVAGIGLTQALAVLPIIVTIPDAAAPVSVQSLLDAYVAAELPGQLISAIGFRIPVLLADGVADRGALKYGSKRQVETPASVPMPGNIPAEDFYLPIADLDDFYIGGTGAIPNVVIEILYGTGRSDLA